MEIESWLLGVPFAYATRATEPVNDFETLLTAI